MTGRQTESAATQHAQQPLWAITSYFNPMRYQRRLANYRSFREHLPVPLITVELSYGTEFELQADEANVLIQLRGGDVMWQKERLLSVALGALPEECTKVVWLDCDVIFGREDWPEEVSRLLDDFTLVQPYSRVHYLPRDLGPGEAWSEGGSATEFSRSSTASAVASGLSARACLTRNPEPHVQDAYYSAGYAWAARRELLDEHGFYDACIVGGGDYAMVAAAYGCFDVVMRRYSMNGREREHYLAWAKPYFESVRGAVSFADYELLHLWHGQMRNRRYRERHEGFGRFEFDPYEDIAVEENGCWHWDSDKSQMHEYVREYFASRREDG